MTETGGAICFNTGINMLLRPTSCGTPFPIVEVKVILLLLLNIYNEFQIY
jgi:hypothetical protein